MAYDYKSKPNIFFKSGNISVITRLALDAAAAPADFSAAGHLATVETNSGIVFKIERDKQVFEGMDEDVDLPSKAKYVGTFVIGETSNKLIALFSGRDPEAAGVIDTTTYLDYEITQLWDNGEIPEFAIKVEGLDPSDRPIGYIFSNVKFSAEELPPFKGKEKPALSVTVTCDMNGGASPGYSYLKTA